MGRVHLGSDRIKMNGIVILHPVYLGLLFPAAALVAVCWLRGKGQRRTFTAVAQLLLAAAMVLGFSGLLFHVATPLSEPGSLVRVADRSDSMRGQDQLSNFSAAGAVAFAESAISIRDAAEANVARTNRSNIAGGISIAAAQGASTLR